MRSGFSRWIPALVAVGVLLAVAGGAWALRTLDPSRARLLPACRFHEMTGLQCPGCGVTRATHHLLHGRVKEAFYYNAFFVSALPGLLVWGGWWWRHWRSGRPLTARATKVNAWLGGGVLAVWLVFWLVRNQASWPLL